MQMQHIFIMVYVHTTTHKKNIKQLNVQVFLAPWDWKNIKNELWLCFSPYATIYYNWLNCKLLLIYVFHTHYKTADVKFHAFINKNILGFKI